MEKCPQDLSCVIRNIQKSPRIPGNIAVIVQLLHNISTVPMTDVDEAKMQVSGGEDVVENHLDGKGMQVSWILCELLGVWEPCFSSQYLQCLAQQVFNKLSLKSEWRAND